MRPILPLLLTSVLAAHAEPLRYLAFQIFTGGANSPELQQSFPPPPPNLRETIAGLRDAIGATGTGTRKLAFVVGPLSFDQTDDEMRAMIANGFDIARETGVAVGFHIDDSMFWGRVNSFNTAANLEWTDWSRTANTGRRLDWSATPKKVLPQLCVNSPAVTTAVKKRAAVIGAEVAKGLAKIPTTGLFLGIIAGWETQIGPDFETGKSTGYCALTNAGFSAAKPPADGEAALATITRDFIGLWAESLHQAGVPGGKVFSHIAFHAAAPHEVEMAFCTHCVPGFSTYRETGHLERLSKELNAHGDPAWASCEGTAIDPGNPTQPASMESYLANLFNRGAIFMNVFGWGVGAADNPFRRAAESPDSLSAYRKFLRGDTLQAAPAAEDLPAKIHRIQAALPAWIQAHGPSQAQPLMQRLSAELKEKRFADAEKTAGEVLKLLEN